MKTLFPIIIFVLTSCSVKNNETQWVKIEPKKDMPEASIEPPTKQPEKTVETKQPLNIKVTQDICKIAKQEKKIKVMEEPISFSKGGTCIFNDTGRFANQLNDLRNGPPENYKIRAISKQLFEVPLPKNVTICNIDFNFPLQSMSYDDEMFLTLNEYIIIASQNYSVKSNKKYKHNGLKISDDGLIKFKWHGENSLYNLYYNHGVSKKYCLGLSSDSVDYHKKCHIPATQTIGQLKLDITAKEIMKLGVSKYLGTRTQEEVFLNFGFITTGDNDKDDCQHSPYKFSISIHYVPDNEN